MSSGGAKIIGWAVMGDLLVYPHTTGLRLQIDD